MPKAATFEDFEAKDYEGDDVQKELFHEIFREDRGRVTSAPDSL
jgi:hypothetical protein